MLWTDEDYISVFHSLPDPYLLLDSNLNIVDASNSYIKITKTVREDIIGKNIFVVFPENPSDPNAMNVTRLSQSLNRVLENKILDTMPLQKYDIPDPQQSNKFIERYWSPINCPVLNENNEVKLIIHRVEDVTDFIKDKHFKQPPDYMTRTQHMEQEIFVRAEEIQNINNVLRDANRELIKSELLNSKLAAIVESTDDAIIGKDLHGMIESWNPGAQKLYGYSAKEMIGQPINIIFPAQFQHESTTILEKCRQGKTIKYRETLRLHKNSQLVHVAMTISPIRNKSGNIVGSCSIAKNLTEWKKYETTILQQRAEIQELSTPVLQLAKGLLLQPIIGKLDVLRTHQLCTELLKAISKRRAKVVVLDVTGVLEIDTAVADKLINLIEATRLMGATLILTGLSNQVANSLVDLSINFSKAVVVGDLEQGIRTAEKLLQDYELS